MSDEKGASNRDERRRSKLQTLRRRRFDLDITQREMAARMGINKSTYNRVERGDLMTQNLARLVAQETGQTVGDVWNEYETVRSEA